MADGDPFKARKQARLDLLAQRILYLSGSGTKENRERIAKAILRDRNILEKFKNQKSQYGTSGCSTPVPREMPTPIAAVQKPAAPIVVNESPFTGKAPATPPVTAAISAPVAKARPVTSPAGAFILGNGPSLSGFDLKRLKGKVTFGMNAAYRHWDRIGWHPTHYACLDEVLGLSHIDPIARLIANADVYGIKKLLLRRNLIRALGPLGHWPNVVDFDALRANDARFAREPLTTGSHTAIWAATLGFSPLVLLGVDADYVEVVAGAERREGNVLEIVREEKNPNYFFDGYQRSGDRYHLPNIGGKSHLRSWRVAAAVLAEMGVVAYNLSLRSQVDVFEFCDAEKAVSGGAIEPIPIYGVFRQRRQPLSLPILEEATG